MYEGMKTCELDEYAANYASTLAAEHPDYALLAGRIVASNLQKSTTKKFSEAMQKLFENVTKSGDVNPLIAADVYDIVVKNKDVSPFAYKTQSLN
jgi:ribonucleoside-diphosphate reductase subunit M1